MVSLVHNDIKHTLSDSEKAVPIALERHADSSNPASAAIRSQRLDGKYIAKPTDTQLGFKQGQVVTAPAPIPAPAPAATTSNSKLDDAAFLVSGPLLPIRQARRGANPNRNYRIIDTRAFMAADLYSSGTHGSIRIGNSSSGDIYGEAKAGAPTLASSAAYAAPLYPSRATESLPGIYSARSSTSSSGGSTKSTIASLSTTNSLSDTVSASDDVYSGRGRQIRLYDKHRMHDVHELPMEPITLSSRNSNHSLRQNARLAHPYAPSTHALELDGRSGTVRVSSLLPGARMSSSNLSSRRAVNHRASASSDAIRLSQHYLVQRVPAQAAHDQGRSPANSNAQHPTTQIKLSSPHTRHSKLHRSLSPDGRALQDTKDPINGDAPVYFADTEMDGNYRAAALGEHTNNRTANKPVAAEGSKDPWGVSSDEGSSRLTDRQRKRQGVRASITTEKFHVLPVSIAAATAAATAAAADGAVAVPNALRQSPQMATPGDSPIAATPSRLSLSPLSESFLLNSYSDISHRLYQESSADERPPLARPRGVPSPEQGAKPTAETAESTQESKTPEINPSRSFEHRASSFDLGAIGRPLSYRGAFKRSGLPSSVTHTPARTSIERDGDLAFARTRTRSSDRLAAPASKDITFAVDAAKPSRKTEEGYEGDSEGLTRSAQRILVQRRNTVAGDKIDDMVPLGRKTSAVKLPRNTGDFSDMLRSKEDRRTLRGSRRKSYTQAFMPIGTQIAPGHANYVLMYNMLTGIRVSVSRCEAKDARPVRADDYIAAHKYSFDVVGDEMTPSSRYDFKFKDYAPWAFRCIREAFHLSTEEYLMSLTDKYILSEVGSSGKSGSFFYYSQDYRFIIKTVHHTEHKFMRQILPQYYEFVRDHPNTLLSRIYGLHRIKLPHGRKVHFIVMSNILPPNKDIHAQFDLKGSMLGRELSAEQAAKPRACMKDKNWINMRQRLHLGPTKRREFVRQLIEDVTLLIRLNIMDYSLLIGIHDLSQGNTAKLRDTTLSMFDPRTTDVQQQNRLTRAHTIRKKVVHTDPVALDSLPLGTVPPLPESMFQELRYSMFYREDGGFLSTNSDDNPAQLIYYLGVIDILTPYNMVKRTEHFVKAIVHDGTQISAVNPRKYGLRFLRFMIRSLGDCADVLPLLEEFERTTYQEICREHRLLSL